MRSKSLITVDTNWTAVFSRCLRRSLLDVLVQENSVTLYQHLIRVFEEFSTTPHHTPTCKPSSAPAHLTPQCNTPVGFTLRNPTRTVSHTTTSLGGPATGGQSWVTEVKSREGSPGREPTAWSNRPKFGWTPMRPKPGSASRL